MGKKHELEEVDWGVLPIVNYRGVYVYKNIVNNTYTLWGREGLSTWEVDRMISESLLSLMKSIRQ